MIRREFLTLLGGAAAWPLGARAQQAGRPGAGLLSRILQMQAEAAADKIADCIRGVESQVGWTTQLPWSAASIEQRRFDALRLLRQVPAITELTQLDANGQGAAAGLAAGHLRCKYRTLAELVLKNCVLTDTRSAAVTS